ncbi:hypothetical protein BV20DRAFT_367556 [Pilatotrama ljubarskyi]|nr:hypothetical protein BV20DRAFT_367556 [Pilatotrama ljubarskyi]
MATRTYPILRKTSSAYCSLREPHGRTGRTTSPSIRPPLPHRGIPHACGSSSSCSHSMVPFPISIAASPSLYSHAQEPISARGWCMQEYFMSLRALIFTSQTLQFRCQTTTQNIGGAFYSPLYERRLPDMLLHRDPPVTEPDSEACIEAHHAWKDLVADYSRRAVSNASDRLVACGALAEEFQRVLRSDYLAGLWRDSLLAHLLWFKRENAHLPLSTEASRRCAGRARPRFRSSRVGRSSDVRLSSRTLRCRSDRLRRECSSCARRCDAVRCSIEVLGPFSSSCNLCHL